MSQLPGHLLRPETAADVPFLRQLYTAIRWDETLMMGMTEQSQRTAFLDQQFDLQRHHYRTHYHDAEFAVIELDRQPIGRLYLWRGERDHRIVDISLLPGSSGRGIGGAILDRVMTQAAEAGRGVSVHVEGMNRARSLYDRKGFREVGRRGPYWLMEWFSDGVSTDHTRQPSSVMVAATG